VLALVHEQSMFDAHLIGTLKKMFAAAETQSLGFSG
jgi:hypothetical protein